MALITLKIPKNKSRKRAARRLTRRRTDNFVNTEKYGQKCQVSTDLPKVRKTKMRPTRNKDTPRKTSLSASTTKHRITCDSAGDGDGNDKRLNEAFAKLTISDNELLIDLIKMLLAYCELLQQSAFLNQFLANYVQAAGLLSNFGALHAKKDLPFNNRFDDQLNAVAVKLALREHGIRMELLESASLDDILAAKQSLSSSVPLNQNQLICIYLIVYRYFAYLESSDAKKE